MLRFARLAVRPATDFHRASFVSGARLSHGLIDRDLSHKLGEEMRYEQEAVEKSLEPPFLRHFREKGLFQIEDIPGKSNVVLSRAFGNEQIRITFSVDDVNNIQEEETLDDFDENQQEDAEHEEESEEVNQNDEADMSLENYPVSANVTITKPKSAMSFDIMMEEGEIGFENIVVLDKKDAENADTVEGEYQRRSVYGGPQFGHLDDDLQLQIERFMAERGIDTGLATFIPNYIEWKEQREYMNWLEKFKSFVDE